MKFSFRRKLMFSCLTLLLVMSGALYVYFHHTLRKSITSSQQDNLINEARLAAIMAARDPERLGEHASALAVEVGRSLAARVMSAVNWGIAYRIIWAWVLTIPASAAVAFVTYNVTSPFLGKQ